MAAYRDRHGALCVSAFLLWLCALGGLLGDSAVETVEVLAGVAL